jgi:hypothetical protein
MKPIAGRKYDFGEGRIVRVLRQPPFALPSRCDARRYTPIEVLEPERVKLWRQTKDFDGAVLVEE